MDALSYTATKIAYFYEMWREIGRYICLLETNNIFIRQSHNSGTTPSGPAVMAFIFSV